MIEVRFHRGLYLPEADLWLDPWDARPRAFVSHAHADHVARHESALCSEVTATLLRARFRMSAGRLDGQPFHVPVTRGGFRLRLLPAGHIPGSAMLHVTRLADGATLLYTGDFKLRSGRTAEAACLLSADTLVMETTFGLPGYRFPQPLEVDAAILRFVGDAFTDGDAPVLLCYSLGKAQEALALLTEHGIPAALYPAAAAMTRACIECGVPGLPDPIEFDGHLPAGHVLIVPPHALRTKLLRGLKNRRAAMLSGWALQPGARFRYQVDAMIPLSDHADHPALMECIQRVKPRRILTVHGFAREFAAELRAQGFDAWSAAGEDQLDLPMQHPGTRSTAARAPWHRRPTCGLADFSDLCKRVAETGSRTAKAEMLAGYLAGLEHEEELRRAVEWLATANGLKRNPARTLPPSVLRQALVGMKGGSAHRLREIHRQTQHLAATARQYFNELPSQPETLSLTAAGEWIDALVATPLSLASTRLLAERLQSLHPAEAETLVAVLSGDLRLGVGTGLVEHALALAFGTHLSAIQRAHRATGDLPHTAVLARTKQLGEPEGPASATPMPSPDATVPATPPLPGLELDVACKPLVPKKAKPRPRKRPDQARSLPPGADPPE